jgi:tRNA dimethylallyltransferase
MPKRAVLIAGPTASGKTALAIKVANATDGVIINADALQVYAKWQVLTARPTAEELARAEHVLYGHVTEDSYSVGNWVKDVSKVIDTTDKTLVIVGGTGLYFSALLNGLSDIPPIPMAIRDAGNTRDTAWFRKCLTRHDPETLARLDSNNPARLQRAWEVLEATGKGLSYWHARPKRPLILREETSAIVLNWQVNDLNKHIDRRFDIMMESGAMAECEAARAAGFDPTLPANRALGAREIIAALDGKISLQDAVIKAKIRTHQFAKRQRTWFRSKMADWQQVTMPATPNLTALLR